MDHYAGIRIIFLGHRAAGDQLLIRLVQLCGAVGKPDGVKHFLGLGLGPLGKPIKNPIGCGLGGQAEKQAAGLKFRCKNLCCRQRSLCLANAHLCFQDQNTRRSHSICGLQNSLLYGIGGKTESLVKGVIIHPGAYDLPGAGQG